MDKQIIIDGVDVSGCKYIDIENFEKPICHCISQRNECEMPCEYNKDCYYKQLKRKEQECEELKEDRERWKSNFNGKVSAIEELLQKFDQLNAEKESLKESLKMFSSTLDWALKSQVELYKRQIDSSVPDDWEYEEVLVLVEQYIEKLKQTLTEIKEIAEPYKMIIKKICENCKKYDGCHACCYKDINCYKYTSPKTNACEEFTYLDDFVPNIIANSILQKISEVGNDNKQRKTSKNDK